MDNGNSRFVDEFFKENQVAFEDGMALNMGQWLSVPFILVGIYYLFVAEKPFVDEV
jgi:prolipoprotein diacylglyceryltransferase